MDSPETSLHTNKAVALAKAKRVRGRNSNAAQLARKGDVQGVIDALTAKQRAFVEEFLKDLNGTQAVLRAGYKTKHPNRIAFQLMEKPEIRLAIDGLRAERTKNSDVTKDYVLRKIMRTLESAEQADNYNAVLRAAELLAKHLGMFVERTEISGPDGGAIKTEQIQREADDFISQINKVAKNSTLRAVE